jgi:hypothetical protein
MRTAWSGERARYANLKVVSFILLVDGSKMSYKNVSACEFGNVKSLGWVVFLDCCTSGEFTSGLNFSVSHGGDVV